MTTPAPANSAASERAGIAVPSPSPTGTATGHAVRWNGRRRLPARRSPMCIGTPNIPRPRKVGGRLQLLYVRSEALPWPVSGIDRFNFPAKSARRTGVGGAGTKPYTVTVRGSLGAESNTTVVRCLLAQGGLSALAPRGKIGGSLMGTREFRPSFPSGTGPPSRPKRLAGTPDSHINATPAPSPQSSAAWSPGRTSA